MALVTSLNGLRVLVLLVAALCYLNWRDATAPPPPPPSSRHELKVEHVTRPSKALVMVTTTQSDMWWLPESPPSWYHFLYYIDNPSAPLTVEKYKGGEAIVYLTFIIDNYDNLPEVVLFHSDDESLWELPMSQQYELGHFREETVRKLGFINMRCMRTCDDVFRLTDATVPIDRLADQDLEVQFSSLLRAFLGDKFVMPDFISAPCCAQFAASREKIMSRPREFWERLRNWVLENDLEDDATDVLMEYTWHMWFGMEPEYCPDYSECLCGTLGLESQGKPCE